MAYCVPLGIPHSQFLDWEESDQDKALAWHREQALYCKGCGTRHDEWQANPNAYIGDLVSCEGCARLEQENQNVPEGALGVRPRLVPEAVGLARVEAGEGIS